MKCENDYPGKGGDGRIRVQFFGGCDDIDFDKLTAHFDPKPYFG